MWKLITEPFLCINTLVPLIKKRHRKIDSVIVREGSCEKNSWTKRVKENWKSEIYKQLTLKRIQSQVPFVSWTNELRKDEAFNNKRHSERSYNPL